MRKLVDTIKRIPTYGWVCAVLYFIIQYSMYLLADLVSRMTSAVNHAWSPRIPFIDDNIPLVGVFVLIYVFSYAFWVFAPLAVSLTKKENFYNYVIGIASAHLIAFLILAFAPTYMDRVSEGLLEAAEGRGLIKALLRFVYYGDGGAMASNLFPSDHCLISMYCYLGIRKQPEISKGFKIYTFVMAILIFLSTLFTRQHYFLDVVSGIGISLLCYVIVQRIDPGKKIVAHKSSQN